MEVKKRVRNGAGADTGPTRLVAAFGDGNREGAMTTLAIGTPFPRQTLRMQPTNHVLRKEALA